jgi:hypothetical protein
MRETSSAKEQEQVMNVICGTISQTFLNFVIQNDQKMCVNQKIFIKSFAHHLIYPKRVI